MTRTTYEYIKVKLLGPTKFKKSRFKVVTIESNKNVQTNYYVDYDYRFNGLVDQFVKRGYTPMFEDEDGGWVFFKMEGVEEVNKVA